MSTLTFSGYTRGGKNAPFSWYLSVVAKCYVNFVNEHCNRMYFEFVCVCVCVLVIPETLCGGYTTLEFQFA